VTPLTRSVGVEATPALAAASSVAEISAELKQSVKPLLFKPRFSTPVNNRFCENAVLP